jgi:HD-GYP domain-containing protein (c-di-GMP phosphodiesterase class II)
MKTDHNPAIHNFARQLATAISTVSLYTSGHHQVQRLCSSMLANIEEAMGDRQDLSLVVIDNALIGDGLPLGKNLHFNRLAQILTLRGIGHIRLVRGVQLEEIQAMVESLAKQNSGCEIYSTANIRYGKVEVRFSYNRGVQQPDELLDEQTSTASYNEEMAKYSEICEGIKKHKTLKVAGIMEIVSGFIATVKSEADPLLALAPLRTSDEYTFTHSANICILNLAQAMALDIDGPLLHDIGIAAMLHDVGKFFIPEEVLNKPGRLDEEDWKLVKQHPLWGAQYLLDTPGVPHLAIITAYEHHLKYNFSGYPIVSHQWQQNLCSQMTTVSDFFDALRTKRPYRGAMEMDKISNIMLEIAGTELHPILTRNFLTIMNKISEMV